LLGGSLGDRFGRRLIYAIGIIIFALASLWCGLAPNINQLIIARAIQGIGGALLVPGSLSIISASFKEEDRGQAIGTWSGSTAITTALGPVLGGWLIEYVSWRAVFFLNLPIALAVLFLVFRFVPESRDEEQSGRLDWAGAALATFSLGALVYGLIESANRGFHSLVVIFALIGGVVTFVVFVFVEARIKSPMMPLSLFRSRDFAGANLLTLFLYAALSGTLYFLPLNLIQVQGYSATAAGAALLPFILTMSLLSRWSGGLIKRYGSRLPLVIGPIIAAVGFALFIRPGSGGHYWTMFFPAVLVLGFGMAISVAPLTTTVMNAVKSSHSGIGSGVNNAVSRTAGLLAVAVLGVVMFRSFNTCLDRTLNQSGIPADVQRALDPERVKLAGMNIPAGVSESVRVTLERAIDECFVFGFRRVSLIGALLALASSMVALVTLRGRSQRS
jgi:EmrB/QacA subfamily drug resistance transporter